MKSTVGRPQTITLENTERAIKNGQSRETGNTDEDKQNKKHNSICDKKRCKQKRIILIYKQQYTEKGKQIHNNLRNL